MKLVLSILGILLSFSLSAQFLKAGKWRGEIRYTDYLIPLSFEVSYPSGEVPHIVFTNGDERRDDYEVSWIGDSLRIRLTPFDIDIYASCSATTMEGVYVKHYRNASYPFSAEYGRPRMMKKSIRPPSLLEERLDMTFDKGTANESKGVGLFAQSGSIITGTVMTRVSDYRYFEGIMDGDSIKMSCFDGAHAFLILGKKIGYEWSGIFVFDEGYQETWVASPNQEAELEDPFEIVTIEPGSEKPYYDLLSAGNGKGALDGDQFLGKVVIVQLFGTWCPNSLDQTKYLVDWYEKNKMKDVEIIASSYEANYSKAYGLRRIDEYVASNNIPYKVVLGGRLSKVSAAMPFNFIQRIEAFPTLVIIDKNGYARYVHSYFNGPATGEYFDQFNDRFNQLVDMLLAE